uniref:Uncharacterized protein n=1 Tax=Romanomermis culicivorax TaxID=13658 RepID=A0A915HI23_ROMCU
MSNPKLDDIAVVEKFRNSGQFVQTKRFTGNYLSFYALIVYSPIGILLALLRFFIAVHFFIVSAILQSYPEVRRSVSKIFYAILGIIIHEDWNENVYGDENSEVLMANHVSIFDSLVVDAIKPCITYSSSNLPKFWRYCTKKTNLNMPYSDGIALNINILAEKAKKFLKHSNRPLLFFPEFMPTNNNQILLKFVNWPFEVSDQGTIDSKWICDVFWLFFVPFTIFKVRILNLANRADWSTVDEFADGCRSVLSSRLNANAIPLSKTMLLKYKERMKEKLHQNSVKLDLNCPVHKIKAIVPEADLNFIREELEKTENFDLTLLKVLSHSHYTSSQDSPSVKRVYESSSDIRAFKSRFEIRKREIIAENLLLYLRRNCS